MVVPVTRGAVQQALRAEISLSAYGLELEKGGGSWHKWV